MLRVLTSTPCTAFAIDEQRECFWLAHADGLLSSVPLAGGPLTVHRSASSPIVGLSGNGRVLVLAHQNGSVSTLNPDDPAGPLNDVATTKLHFGQAIITRAHAPTAAIVSRPVLN